jgi:hypothetical protein
MCRFSSREDEGYKQVLGEIRILISEIPKEEQDLLDKDKEGAKLETASESQTTIASATRCM